MIVSKRLLIMIFLVLWIPITVGFAQDAGQCPAFVERAVQRVGNNCNTLDRNTACYGNAVIETVFTTNVEAGFFDAPADRTDLSIVGSMRTSPLDMGQDQWGISVMSLQVDMPDLLPGQSVIFLLVGDAFLGSDVPPEEAVTLSAPVQITLAQDAVVYDTAQGDGQLGTIPAGTVIQTDAINPTSRRLRTAFNNVPAWISLQAVDAQTAAQLPAVTANSHTPMQAFYFTTGVQIPSCREAPSFIAVQGPQSFTIGLTMNGVDIRVGSLVLLRSLDANQIGISVVEGKVETVDGQVVQADQTLLGLVDDGGRIMGWNGQRPFTEDEKNAAALAHKLLDELGLRLPPVKEEPEPKITATPTPGTVANVCPNITGDVTYVVQRGDTLYRIARQYDASALAIMRRNGLTNPDLLHAGQQLVIPDPCSGFAGIPGVTLATPTAESAGVCAGFAPTSPVQGISHDEQITFYWDPAAGAAGYRLILYDPYGNVLRSVDTPADQTHAQMFVGLQEVRPAQSFQWAVSALVNRQVVCTTRRVTVTRDEFPRSGISPTTPLAPAVLWGCGATNEYIFQWSNLAAGDTIRFTFTEFGVPVTVGPSSLPSGTLVRSTAPVQTTLSNAAAVTGSGLTIPLTPASLSC